jgi:hypothetical protein
LPNSHQLYRNPVPLDADEHRHKRLLPLTDYSIAGAMHASYIGIDEFALAALEYVIMFIDTAAESGGRAQVSPAVLLGMTPGENLMVEGTRWTARYVPAFIRRYPFKTTDTGDPATVSVLVDDAWSGFSDTQGEPLFEADGRPTPTLRSVLESIDRFEADALRTREFCAKLVQHDLLREMKADATLPSGQTLSVKGFYAIEEAALRSLPERTVLELHRDGSLAMMYAHILSLAHLRPLIERKAQRLAGNGGSNANPA